MKKITTLMTALVMAGCMMACGNNMENTESNEVVSETVTIQALNANG